MTKHRQRQESNVKPCDHWNQIMSLTERVFYNGHNDDADSFNIYIEYILVQAMQYLNRMWLMIDIHTHLPKYYENPRVLIFPDISCSGSGWSLVEWCIVTLLGGGEYIWASGIYPGTLDQRMIWLWCADRLLFISADPLIFHLGTLSCNPSLKKWTFSTHLVAFRFQNMRWLSFLRILKYYIWYAWPSL